MEKDDEKKEDPHFKVVKEKLKKFLTKDKPEDVLIIKAHLIAEYYLNQALLLQDNHKPSQIEKLTFHEKVGKALDSSSTWESDLKTSLYRLNKLRNKVGHELEFTLSESDMDALGCARGKEYIVKKYELDNNIKELLRYFLTLTVIDCSLVVFDLVKFEQEKKEKESDN